MCFGLVCGLFERLSDASFSCSVCSKSAFVSDSSTHILYIVCPNAYFCYNGEKTDHSALVWPLIY